MPDEFDALRTPAANLWVTFRPDGSVLIELLADWYTALRYAQSHVDDSGDISSILTSWANSTHHEIHARRPSDPASPGSDYVQVRRGYARGFEIGFVGGQKRNRSAMNGSAGDERQFLELFGSRVPNDPPLVNDFAARLARQMRVFFLRSQAKANARLAGGGYLAVLNTYVDQLRMMRGDQSAYRRVEHTILAIVEDELYLRLAEDSEARDLLVDIDKEMSVLYGQCMDLERGGHRR